MLKYLEGNINHLPFIDTNQNIKNCLYQLMGGYCTYVIGLYCFDAQLLNMAGVTKELVQVEDFAFDAVALCLASPSITKNDLIRYILYCRFDNGCDINFS